MYKIFWLSWYSIDNAFEIHSPWWRSGYRGSDNAPSIVAAVCAQDEQTAKSYLIACHDNPPADLEWRFCEEKAAGWSPFASDRFPRGDWMKWPYGPGFVGKVAQ